MANHESFNINGENLLKKVKMKDMEDRSSVEGLMDDDRMKRYAFYYRSFPYTVEFECTVKRDHSFGLPGWYPQAYCLRHSPLSGEYTVSLEDFARHA